MKVQVSNYKREHSTYLQGVGHTSGTPAGDLEIGDSTIWNYGYIETVKAIVKETKAFVWLEIETSTGYVGVRKLKKSRIVAHPVEEING